MIISRRAAARGASALAALLLIAASPGAAFADGGTPSSSATANSDGIVNSDGIATDPAKVDLVLDVSGSMATADLGGMTRIAAAQRAFDQVVDGLPAQDRVGVRTLGATYPGTSRTLGCADSRQVVPVGPLDRTAIKNAVARLSPTGWTPIGLALRKAAADLGRNASSRRVILITDGEDDCAPPDPCDVARELAAQGTRLTVDTLGLTLDDKVRRQLTCIAQATGGTYTAVTSEHQLSNRLDQLVTRATDVSAPPAAVGGAASCATAPLLTPGVYTDREAFQEDRWYRVAVGGGNELRASASVSVDRTIHKHYGVTMDATSLDGRPLASGTGGGSQRTDVVSTGLRYAATGPGAGNGGDNGDGTVCLDVANDFSADSSVRTTPGFPVELSIDLVQAAPAPSTRAQGLGQGWLFLVVLAGIGLITGLALGWLSRWRVRIWRES